MAPSALARLVHPLANMNVVRQPFDKTMALLMEEVPPLLGEVDIQPSAPPEWQHSKTVLGTIGFGGAAMRGAILIMAEADVWRSVAPPGIAAGADSDILLCDLVGELCNMIVGRFKNRLLRFGVELGCGMPAAAYGSLALASLPASRALQVGTYRIETAAGCLYLRTDILFSDHFVFPADEVGGVEPALADLFF